MARRKRFIPYEPGMRQIMNARPLRRAAVRAARLGLASGKAGAPRQTGRFVKSLRVVGTTVPGGRWGKRRAGALIESPVPYSPYVRVNKKHKSFMSTLVPHVNRYSGGRRRR